MKIEKVKERKVFDSIEMQKVYAIILKGEKHQYIRYTAEKWTHQNRAFTDEAIIKELEIHFQNWQKRIKVKFKKLRDNAVLPKYAKENDAGMDLTVCAVKKGLFKDTYYFGLSIEPPKDCFIDLRPRSSVHKLFLWLSNSCGTGDAGFRNEYTAVFYKIPFLSKSYKVGERAIQIIIRRFEPVQVVEAFELSESERGFGGYGSTGK